MNKNTLIIFAAAAAGLYFIAKTATGISKQASPASTGAARQTALPGSIDFMGPMPQPGDGLLMGPPGYAVANAYGNAGYLGVTK
jgi:hypothetical protein